MLRSILVPIALLLLNVPGQAFGQSGAVCAPRDDLKITLETKNRDTITGTVCIEDGDSFAIGPAFVRLRGIDAPRLGRNCLSVPEKIPPRCRVGVISMDGLADLLNEGTTCRAEKADGFNRWLAICRNSSGVDISAEMVRQGFACASRAYENTYASLEDEARSNKRGIWADGSGFKMSRACTAKP